MNTEEILKEIKKENLNILQGQERVKILENLLLGDEKLIHTANGFCKYIKEVIKYIGGSNFTDYNAKNMGITISLIGFFNNRGICIDYNNWKINIKIEERYIHPGYTYCVYIYRFKEIGILKNSYDEMISKEQLININHDDIVSVFKDGKYIDYLKENLFDKMIAWKMEKTNERRIKEIKQQQENFTHIEF